MNFTKLTVKDIKKTYKLLHKIISYHALYPADARKCWKKIYTPAKLKAGLKNNQWIVLLAKNNAKVIGFINVFQIEGGVAVCDWCIVHQRYQKLGIGCALMKRLFMECKKKGCHKLITNSLTRNKAGNALMLSTGWQKVARLKKHSFKLDYYLWEKAL